MIKFLKIFYHEIFKNKNRKKRVDEAFLFSFV